MKAAQRPIHITAGLGHGGAFAHRETSRTTAFDKEIFVPVAPITTFRDDEEAIALATATEYGLVAAAVSPDLARAQGIADGLHSGVVYMIAASCRSCSCRRAPPPAAPRT